ncbi:hypothetical protein ACFWNN_30845 [Lentzea sp. NPDC058450]|uniref:hypothetical protein n=1 Tax=Lentzea sp. NPDC058450 TaxID=3346505 RepID=UPI00364BDB16
MDYTRRDLAQAVLDAHPDSKRGLNMFYGAFSDDMKAFQVRLAEGLQKAFGVNLTKLDAFTVMIRSTVDSNAAITGPGSGFGEFSLIAKKVEGSRVIERMQKIGELNTRSREIHLDMVDELLGLMEPPVEVVTSEDLRAIGVDDTPPDTNDYEMDY